MGNTDAVRRFNPNRHPAMKAALAVMCVSVIAPLVLLAVWCFVSSWPYPDILPSTIDFRGFEQIAAGTGELPQVMCSSILISLATAILAVVVSTMTAQALVEYDVVGKWFFDFIVLLPIIVPDLCVVMGMSVFFLRIGIAYSFTALILAMTVRTIPYAVKIMVDVRRMVGNSLVEQAIVLGSSRTKAFFQVCLPKLIPGMCAAAGMVFVVSYGLYFLTLIIGGSAIKTLAVVVVPYISSGDRTVAAIYAFAYVLSGFVGFLVFDGLARVLSKGKDVTF